MSKRGRAISKDEDGEEERVVRAWKVGQGSLSSLSFFLKNVIGRSVLDPFTRINSINIILLSKEVEKKSYEKL